MRLELTMFMLSLSSTISRVCLTVQKPTARTYRIEKTLPQYSEVTIYATFAGSSHALHHTDITRVGTPCSFFIQPLSPTYSCTPFAFDLILGPLWSATSHPFFYSNLSSCCGMGTSQHLLSTRLISNIPKPHRGLNRHTHPPDTTLGRSIQKVLDCTNFIQHFQVACHHLHNLLKAGTGTCRMVSLR
jgi:hypothetical protein